MTRLRYNGLSTTLGASLTSSATAVTFAAALTHSGGTAVPTIGAGDSIPLSILDSTGKLSEVVYLTAYTSGATTGTITRGQEGTTGVSHASGDRVVHAPTTLDIGSLVLLKEIELSADAASIAFTSADIPTTGYRHLKLVITGRTTASALVTSAILLSYNGDTTAANYLSQRSGNNAGSNSVGNASDGTVGYLAGSTATANSSGEIETLIANYRRTTFFKTAVGISNAGLAFVGTVGQTWKNTAAVDSISLTPSTAGNFVAGTVAQLYGIV